MAKTPYEQIVEAVGHPEWFFDVEDHPELAPLIGAVVEIAEAERG